MTTTLTVLIFMLLVTWCNFLKLPPGFHKCNREKNNFDECLSKAIHDAMPNLYKPLNEYGVPCLEPFVAPREIMLEFGDEKTGLRHKYTEYRLSGLTKVESTKARMDFERKILWINLTLYDVKIQTNFEGHGRLLLAPVDIFTFVTFDITTSSPSLFCDFEHEDLCGWNHDLNHDFDWTRLNYATPSGTINTGPSDDHTKGPGKDGYYMYIESSGRRINDTARLISPVYDKADDNVCFEFYYHMYGTSIGSLRVYLKKVNETWDLKPANALFIKNGNQGNKWYRGFIILGSVPTDFQVVIEGVRGPMYTSDIAVDDVKVIRSCRPEDEIVEGETTTEEYLSSEPPPSVESCENRCNTSDNSTSSAVITCDCDEACFDRNRCCPDYFDFCVSGTTSDNVEESTDYSTEMTTRKTTTREVPKTTAMPSFTTVQKSKTTVLPKTTTAKMVTKQRTATQRKTPPSPPTTLLKTTQQKPTTPPPKLTTTSSRRTTTLIPTTPNSDKKDESKIIYAKPDDDFDDIADTSSVEYETPGAPVKKDKETEITNPDYGSDKTFDHQIIKDVAATKTSNAKLIIFPIGVVFGVLFAMAGMAFVARRYQLCHCRRIRLHQSSNGDSQSDVRFLTSDEVLDFGLPNDYNTL